jgi:hypothetical protein
VFDGGWSLESPLSRSSFILFYFILGVFAPQKLDRPQPRVRFFECVFFDIPAASNLSRT